ncbi:unnamed protein product [Adineta ricciae]|uniref:Uncharacterized protein n=1 Tax=Adineta ricciae TaxID=249248 RepID=A0A815H6D0_ADIRI|nr:unnamed protein product [Adineta ricciae]
MNDLAENMGFDAAYELAPADEITERTSTVFNGTINSTLQSSIDQDFDRNNDALRLLLITIAIIIVLVCITISTILFIFICLNRRRNSKRREKQDRPLISESTDKTSRTNSSGKKKPKPGKTSGKTTVPSSTSTTNEKIPVGQFYYDNLDDIPYIDESRPTSYIDITRV